MESLNMSQLNISASQERKKHKRSSLNSGYYVESDEYEEHTVTDPENEYVCEYQSDIWQALRLKDSGRHRFHLQSPQLEYRGSLVDMLRTIKKDMGYSMLTLHTAVFLLDSFMDDHRLRVDRLVHTALACISLAAKTEEKMDMVPTLQYLSSYCPHPLEGKVFRQLEWMVGQHVDWRLMAPTPASYAMLLVQYVVTDADLKVWIPLTRSKRDAEMRMNYYLDLSLCSVKLNLEAAVDVGCACVACARFDLGLEPWPTWLAERTGRTVDTVRPVSELLQRMKQILKSREKADSEIDQGYSSAKTSPSQTPSTSPKFQVSPASSSCSTAPSDSYRRGPIRNDEYTVLDMDDSRPTVNYDPDSLKFPTVIDMPWQRVDSSSSCRNSKSSRVVDASLGPQLSTRKAVKRGSNVIVTEGAKRTRLLEPQ